MAKKKKLRKVGAKDLAYYLLGLAEAVERGPHTEYTRRVARQVSLLASWVVPRLGQSAGRANPHLHRSGLPALPENVTLLALPPYSPELNPMEKLWHSLRSHYWSNRTYVDYGDLRFPAIDA